MAKGIGDVIYTLLNGDANVSAIVGTKIFPYVAVESEAYPYIVFTQEGLEPTDTKDGVSELDKSTWDIECYSETLSEVEDLADKVRAVLDRYKGTTQTIVVDHTTFLSEGGGYADADRVFMKIQSYKFWTK